MIDLDRASLETVKNILRTHAAGMEVRAFGSRVNGTARPYSDLDLVLIGRDALPLTTLGNLKDAFAESDLPIQVDVIDWNATAESFRRVIERGFEVIQAAG